MICSSSVLAILQKRVKPFERGDLSRPFVFRVSSYDKYYAKIAAEFCREALKLMGCTVSLQKEAIIAKRWTLLSSPFAHKTARTQFERRLSVYSVKFTGIDKEGRIQAKWYLTKNAPPPVQISEFDDSRQLP
jgi:ribosomal protein S10